jgi:regulator of RNase E activity RraA
MLTKEKREALLKLTTPLVGDAMWSLKIDTQVDPAIKPVFPFTKIAGTAVTLQLKAIENKHERVPLPHYQEAFKAGLEVYAPIMVIELPKESWFSGGIWGGGASTQGKANGYVGVVVDGSVRDTEEMKELEFPAFARQVTNSFIIGKVESVSFNQPVTIGGVKVRPGDIVFGDNDGVVIIPAEHLDAVIGKAQAVQQWEAKVLGLVKRGVPMDDADEQIGPMP